MGVSPGRNVEADVERFCSNFNRIEQEVKKVIVGLDQVVQGALAAVFAGGHALMEGVPGLGKTLLVKSISEALGLRFKRIQFTPDLMPSDVTGTQVLTEDANGRRAFEFKPGPIFSNIVLADEINRATPKTQAALLEAMEERQITVLDQTHRLEAPFFVLATQNPIELEGTYPLPEAQLDRFLLKLEVPIPSEGELREILNRTTGSIRNTVEPVFDAHTVQQEIESMKALVRDVVVADPLLDVLVSAIHKLNPKSKENEKGVIEKYVRFGPGPRGAQGVLLVAKVFALLDRRMNVSFEDLKRSFVPALRHRVITNFQAESEGITSEDLIRSVTST